MAFPPHPCRSFYGCCFLFLPTSCLPRFCTGSLVRHDIPTLIPPPPPPPPPFFFFCRAVWRDAAFLFNTFGSTGDLLEKVFVFLTVLALCGIGVGAHSAFTATATWVSACAFFSLFFVAATSALFGFREPRLRAASEPPRDDAATAAGRSPPRRSLRAVLATNFVVASAVVTTLTALPYFAALVVGTRSRRAVVALYWVGAVVNQSRASAFPLLYRKAVRRRAGIVTPAVNIEALTEKVRMGEGEGGPYVGKAFFVAVWGVGGREWGGKGWCFTREVERPSRGC